MAVAHLLYGLGVLQLWQAAAMRGKAVVLMYHRVLTDDERRRTGSHPGIVVSQRSFARQMALLRRRFTVLTVAELARRIEQREPLPDRSCVITFDDGWRDNFTNGLPILEAHALPATVFLPANFVGRDRLFWREGLTHALVEAVAAVGADPARRARLRELLAPSGLDAVADLAADDPRPAVIAAIAARPRLRAPDAERIVEALRRDFGVRLDAHATPDAFMDRAQLESMSGRRVTFGGHGAEHLRLTELPAADAQAEIESSKAFLDAHFNGAVPTFSYPNGSWNREVADAVRRAGYRLAFTTETGFVSCDDDPFALRRINIHEDATASAPMFLARVVGLF